MQSCQHVLQTSLICPFCRCNHTLLNFWLKGWWSVLLIQVWWGPFRKVFAWIFVSLPAYFSLFQSLSQSSRVFQSLSESFDNFIQPFRVLNEKPWLYIFSARSIWQQCSRTRHKLWPSIATIIIRTLKKPRTPWLLYQDSSSGITDSDQLWLISWFWEP